MTDARGNGRPDLLVFWIDNPDGPNKAFIRIGEDLDRDGVPLTGWGTSHFIPGSWGNDTSGAGASFANVRGTLRPDIVVLTLDAPDGPDAGYIRVLSPPLPTWNLVRPVPNGSRAEKIAAVVVSENAIVLANRGAAGPANAPIQIGIWDQTDLNENQGSNTLEFAGPVAVNDARVDLAVAVAARTTDTANVFMSARTILSGAVFRPPYPSQVPQPRAHYGFCRACGRPSEIPCVLQMPRLSRRLLRRRWLPLRCTSNMSLCFLRGGKTNLKSLRSTGMSAG